MTAFYVDRIEEGYAVLLFEVKQEVVLPVSSFDFEISEGSVLLFDGENFTLSIEKEEEKRNENADLLEKLLNRN
ncbi:MAG: DUF3006 domain-containing protein [Ruminococcaceae bacterium]|nr:DUF3006 domain-containing protein [Oscillospiraceae bacterium]